MKVVKLDDYNIVIGNDAWSSLVEFLEQQNYASIFVICDENTHEYCLPKLRVVLSAFELNFIKIKAGELHKNLMTCTAIWQQMMDRKASRRSLAINLGGGVIGDMGGFCASTFKRGMDFIQIPTTLLSQVDASIGGKLGIDFQGIKNSIGLFNNPKIIIIDTDFYETLPYEELRSGFAEVIKHALIADKAQWKNIQEIEDLTTVNWEEVIIPSLLIKRQIVEEDPFERGIRKALNFGHTIGHAVESYFLETENRLLHGEAIAIGMICEAWLSTQLVDFSKVGLNRIENFILNLYGKVNIPEVSFEELIGTMRQDKKNEDHNINFTLLEEEGKAIINQTATISLIEDSLRYYQKL